MHSNEFRCEFSLMCYDKPKNHKCHKPCVFLEKLSSRKYNTSLGCIHDGHCITFYCCETLNGKDEMVLKYENFNHTLKRSILQQLNEIFYKLW